MDLGWLDTLMRLAEGVADSISHAVGGLDWSSFLPDTIVAIITGTVVGLVLLLAQRSQEHRQELARIDVESKRIRYPLTLALGGVHEGFSYSNLSALTSKQAKAVSILDPLPIGEWYEKNPTDLVAMCFHFQAATLGVRSAGDALSADVGIWLRRDGRNGDFGRRYIHAKLQSAPPDFLKSVAPSPGIAEMLDGVVAEMRSSHDIARRLSSLLDAQAFMADVEAGLLRAATVDLRAKDMSN